MRAKWILIKDMLERIRTGTSRTSVSPATEGFGHRIDYDKDQGSLASSSCRIVQVCAHGTRYQTIPWSYFRDLTFRNQQIQSNPNYYDYRISLTAYRYCKLISTLSSGIRGPESSALPRSLQELVNFIPGSIIYINRKLYLVGEAH